MEAHASAGDWVQIGGLRHHVKPATRTIREVFGLMLRVFRVTTVKKGG
jgi:hypothetical protein